MLGYVGQSEDEGRAQQVRYIVTKHQSMLKGGGLKNPFFIYSCKNWRCILFKIIQKYTIFWMFQRFEKLSPKEVILSMGHPIRPPIILG